MGSLRLLFVSSVFTYRALFMWLNPAAYFFNKMLVRLMQMSFFSLLGLFGGSQPLAFYLVGNAVIVAYRPMFTIASTVAGERRQGTLPYLVASPANRVVLFFGRGIGQALDGLIDVTVAFLIASLVFGLDVTNANWVGVALSIVVAVYGASALGLFLGAAAYLVLDANFLANTVMFAILLLTGANVPLAELPGFLVPVSTILPLTRSVEAARIFTSGGELAGGVGLLAIDAVVGTLWALFGLALFSWIEAQARRRGSLEGF